MGLVKRHARRAILRSLKSKLVDVSGLGQLGGKTRDHPTQQIRKIATCLRKFGFVLPILIDGQNRVIAGWAVVLAAKLLGQGRIPAVLISDLSDAELRTLRLALNKLSEYAIWNEHALRLELTEIIHEDPNIDLEDTGFEIAELDSILDDGGMDQEDELPVLDEQAVAITQPGDQWKAGDHVIRCDDALNSGSYSHLLGSLKAGMVFTDPPFNLPIGGSVTRSRFATRHDFAMAKGELSSPQFQSFLETALGHAAQHSRDGAIHFVCMDWRHLPELFSAGTAVYSVLKNLCVWNKSNAGMGSLYRSQHELVAVYKVGNAKHINNIELGRHGRHRTNVWNYLGQSALNCTRKSKLSLHPTVKPVAMIADAIRDCSNRGDIILDCFGGAGTTLIAAEKTGRRARILELNPIYIDVTIERWQRLTGKLAYHAKTGQPFSPVDNQTR
jgi:DNA modification methylase